MSSKITHKKTSKHLELSDNKSNGGLIVTQTSNMTAAKDVIIGSKTSNFFRKYSLFLVIVIIPVLVSSLYLMFFAADQYVSEARFVVRSSSGGGGVGIGGMVSLSQSQNFGRSIDDGNSVIEYIRSRDILEDLIKNDHLQEIIARPEADLLSRYPLPFMSVKKEALYRHFMSIVDINNQSGTGITVLTVRAFRAADARDLANALLKYSEIMINRMNDRARNDSIVFADELVTSSQQRVDQLQKEISDFRNREAVIDPTKQSLTGLNLIGQLSVQAAQDQASLSQLLETAPSSPQITSLRSRIRSYQTEIEQQRSQMVGSNKSMATKITVFDQLTLKLELARKSLVLAFASLQTAKNDALRQKLYLERIVEPNVADQASYPKKLQSILSILAIAMCVFLILNGLIKNITDHD